MEQDMLIKEFDEKIKDHNKNDCGIIKQEFFNIIKVFFI